jgi:hypothetical protein
MSKPKTPAANPKAMPVERTPTQTRAQSISQAALRPSINSASVIEAYQGNLMGKEVDFGGLVDGLRETFKEVKGGDLATIEAMLISQATALQTIFTSLARRAANQEQMRHYEAFLGLALKAQAQSRATISALVDLKYPRQATFVKQANIANGPQQVNNGGAPASSITHAEENRTEQIKLLEDKTHERTHLDIGATPAAKRSHQAVEAVGKVNRAKKPRG